MTGQQLRNSILQEAIHGRLVPNVLQPGEKTGEELLKDILAERQKKENEEKGKKAKKLTLSTIEEEPWELPKGWCWCKLSDLFSIVSARRVHQSDWRTSGIPFYRTREIGWLAENRTDVKPELYIEESLYERFKQSGYPSPGDIMMTAVGTVGKTYIVQPGDKFYYKDASVLCLENISKVNPKYICHVIASEFFKSMIAEEAMGTTVATITMVRANEYIVPLPPLSIQKAIVEKIEELLPLIDEYDKAAVELETLNKILPDKLRKSVLQEAIHGTLVPNDIPEGEATGAELLQQILKERQEKENKEKGKKAKKLSLSTIEEEPWELPKGWCWCRGKDIFFPMESIKPKSDFVYIDTDAVNNKKNVIDNPKNVLLKNAPSRATRRLHANDILFSMVRPYLNNIAYVDDRFASAIGTTGFYVITTSSSLYQPYIFKMMLSDYVVSGLTEYMKGDNSPSINNGHIEDFLYPIPPLSIQHRIVEKIDEVFSAIDKLKV